MNHVYRLSEGRLNWSNWRLKPSVEFFTLLSDLVFHFFWLNYYKKTAVDDTIKSINNYSFGLI